MKIACQNYELKNQRISLSNELILTERENGYNFSGKISRISTRAANTALWFQLVGHVFIIQNTLILCHLEL